MRAPARRATKSRSAFIAIPLARRSLARVNTRGRPRADLNREMKKTTRLLLAMAAVTALALVGGVATASACGTDGYSYAGVGAPTYGSAISAVITPLGPFSIPN